MVNYPNLKRTVQTQTIQSRKQDTSRRGYNLEHAINESNIFYLTHKKANIHKKPTPIQVVRVDYPSRNAAKIVEAYYKIPSTTDYNGIYRGKYIDFEAKECQQDRFPFRNIHPHQIDHLESILFHGGISFLLISFTNRNEVYLIDAAYVVDKYHNAKRQSLAYQDIKDHGFLVNQGYLPKLDYLKTIDQVYFKEE